MNSAALFGKISIPLCQAALSATRTVSCEMAISWKGHAFLTAMHPEGRGALCTRVRRAKNEDFEFPKEYYDEEATHLYLQLFLLTTWEWQAKQREKTEELRRRQQEEEDEEEKKVAEYRAIGSRFRGYPVEDIKNAKLLVASFIKSGADVEERIVEAADEGELTELVLLVIWNRLELAQRDGERDAIQALDLLYRRVEAEMLKRQASPAMRLLNELLNLHDGFDDKDWLQRCRTRMFEIFPREDPFTIFAPPGIDLSTHTGPIDMPLDDNILFRVDFIKETDELMQGLEDQVKSETVKGSDPESVAIRLKLQEKERAFQQLKALRDLAISLKW